MKTKFTCSKCQKVLTAAAELAGKKTRCPGCRAVLTIPAPVAAPAKPATAPPDQGDGDGDLDALAAAAFIDKPPEPEPTTEPAFIDFPCPFCDEPLHVAAAEAGKNIPCAECGRIVKVPIPVKKEKADWRKADKRLPAGARRDSEPAPEGAWGTAISRGHVSRESLEEADAIPITKEPLTVGQKVKRGLLAAAGLAAIITLVLVYRSHRHTAVQVNALEMALAYVPGSEKTKQPALAGADLAEVLRGAGEFALRTANNEEDLKKAANQYGKARAEATKGDMSPGREALLIELALAQVELGGDKEQVRSKKRLLSPQEAFKQVTQTLQKLRSPEGQAEALREVSRKLIAINEPKLAITLVPTLGSEDDRPERLALVGLEMVRAGRKEGKDSAESMAAEALALYPAPGGKDKKRRLPNSPSLIALLLVLGQEAKAESYVIGPPKELDKPFGVEIRAGYARGYVYQGKLDQARRIAIAPGPPTQRLEAVVALAEAAVEKNLPDAADAVNKAVQLFTAELKNQNVSPWLLFKLARLCGQTGAEETSATPVVNGIKDAELQARARLEILRPKLNDAKKAETLLEAAGDEHPLVREAIARANARHGNAAAALKKIETWPEEAKPFGYLGVALGGQDAK